MINEKESNYSGRIIAELRASNNESQQALADAIGVSRSMVRSWEAGDRRIKIDDLIALSVHYHVSADYILGLSSAATDDRDARFVCDYTGLSKETVEKFHKYAHLRNHKTGILSIFDGFIDRFYDRMLINLYLIKSSIDKGKKFLEQSEDDDPGHATIIYGPLRMRLYTFTEFCRRIPNELFGSDEVFDKLENQSWIAKTEHEIDLEDFLKYGLEDESGESEE